MPPRAPRPSGERVRGPRSRSRRARGPAALKREAPRSPPRLLLVTALRLSFCAAQAHPPEGRNGFADWASPPTPCGVFDEPSWSAHTGRCWPCCASMRSRPAERDSPQRKRSDRGEVRSTGHVEVHAEQAMATLRRGQGAARPGLRFLQSSPTGQRIKPDAELGPRGAAVVTEELPPRKPLVPSNGGMGFWGPERTRPYASVPSGAFPPPAKCR
jgi:hypothetical protein